MDDEEFAVEAGDAVMAPPGVDHGFRCVGDDHAKASYRVGQAARVMRIGGLSVRHQ